MSAGSLMNGVRHEPLAGLVEGHGDEHRAEIVPKLLVFAPRSNRGGTP
jgi:hypothetical protein